MNAIKKILIIIDAEEDFSTSPDGLPVEIRKALHFVRDKAGVELKLFSVGYEKYLHHSFYSIGYEYTLMRKEYLKRMRECVAGLATRLKDEGYQVSSEVVWSHPRYETIVKQATEFNADMVVHHVRAHAKIEHFLLTNESWQLVRYCQTPLLLVKDSPWPEAPVFMAAVDPLHSHNKPLQLDKRLIMAADRASEQTGGSFHVVHAYNETARPFAAEGKLEKAHADAFNELLQEFDIPEQHQHLIDETPLHALIEYSEKLHANVIVMGAISRSRFSEAVIGSTAERTLDYIKTDTLIIKPKPA
ncbi:MAG: universal stress protein [Pseudohongiellaceae bacterium]